MPRQTEKFLPFRTAQTSLQRSRLLDKFTAHTDARVIVLHGPAGYGKSTLAAQYLERKKQQGHEIAWLTLEPCDNEIQGFSSLIQQWCCHHAEAYGHQKVLPVHRDWLLSGLADTDQPLVFVIDDFEHLNDATVLSTLDAAIQNFPPHYQLLICGRQYPELKLSRLALSDELLVVGPDELRFNRQECHQFFAEQSAQNPLQPNHIDTLYLHTEGWPAVLKLSALVINTEQKADELLPLAPLSEHCLLMEYFQRSVLERLPDKINAFLGLTSCLEKFNQDLCNNIAGTDDARYCIDYLKKRGLFINSTDASGRWYSYQKVFREFLYYQYQETHPESVSNAHRRACQWFLDQGQSDLAIEHALKSGQHQLAARLLDQHALEYRNSSQIFMLQQWASQLPEREIVKHQGLMLALLWNAVFLGDQERAEQIAIRLEQAKDNGTLPDEYQAQLDLLKLVRKVTTDQIAEAIADDTTLKALADSNSPWVVGSVFNAHILFAMITDRYQDLRHYIQQAHSRPGTHYTTAYLYSMHAMALLQQGQVHQAKDILIAGKHQLAKNRDDHYTGRYQLLPVYASCLYEMGQVNEADALLKESLPLIRDVALPDWIALAYLTASRVHHRQGHWDQAMETMKELEHIGYDEGVVRLVAYARWEMTRLYTLNGNLAQAEELIMKNRGEGLKCSTNEIHFHPADTEADDIAYLRFLLARGDDKLALELAKQHLRETNPSRRFRRLKLHLVSAMALRSLGHRRDSLRTLSDVLRESSNIGIFRSILDEGERLINLVTELQQANLNEAFSPDSRELDDYCERLLKAAGRNSGQKTKTVMEPERELTRRELELLQLACDGHTNKVIGTSLQLTENTVKWHLRNAYGKLGVKKRTQAVAVCRELGLIE